MAITGRGQYPLNSRWLVQQYNASGNTSLLYKPVFQHNVASTSSLQTIMDDWFFEAVSSVVTADLSVTQENNSVNSSGAVSISANFSISQAGDALSADGTLAAAGIVGEASLTQADNTASSSGVLLITGSSAVTQDNNTVTSSGTVKITGSSDITQVGDSLSSISVLGIAAIANITQADNTISSAGVINIIGSVSATQADNIVVADGRIAIYATATVSQQDDQLLSSGASGSSISGDLSITQDDNTVASTATITTQPVTPTVSAPTGNFGGGGSYGAEKSKGSQKKSSNTQKQYASNIPIPHPQSLPDVDDTIPAIEVFLDDRENSIREIDPLEFQTEMDIPDFNEISNDNIAENNAAFIIMLQSALPFCRINI